MVRLAERPQLGPLLERPEPASAWEQMYLGQKRPLLAVEQWSVGHQYIRLEKSTSLGKRIVVSFHPQILSYCDR
jgi:hypothetical protein